MKSKVNYLFAVGRRKTSTARVRLFKGAGENLINGKKVLESLIEKPFKIIDSLGKFYFTSKVSGGGVKSQVEATIHGISRALVKLDTKKFRTLLKKEGLLIRDSRE